MPLKKSSHFASLFSPRLFRPRKKVPRRRSPFFQVINHIRRYGTIGTASVAFALLAGAWYTGYVQSFYDYTCRMISLKAGYFGYALDDIYIQGRHHISHPQLLKTIGLRQKDSMFVYSPQEIKERLEANPWVDSAIVRRELPSTLHVHLHEKQPAAVWQCQKIFYLIDKAGTIIQKIKAPSPQLPLVVGEGAAPHTGSILTLLNQYPKLQAAITGIVRVNKRRWNLILHDTLTVKLPETHVEAAMLRLNLLVCGDKLNLSDIKAIDLRLPKQLIARVHPHTAKRLKLEELKT